MKIVTDTLCTGYSQPGHPERPERVSRTQHKLRNQTELAIDWVDPGHVDDSVILRAHSPAHLARLEEPEDFTPDTPYFDGIGQYARRSVAGAITAMNAARRGEMAFSLMRPPGHHATRDRAMGFCYLNSIAVAALEALATGTKRVAVFDFDVHHGNGTEAILCNVHGAAFFSVHQWPLYPGTGTENVGRNCFNYPVRPCAPRAEYRATLERALEDLKRFKPELVAVSAGFDAYAHDPIANEALQAEDYYWLGQQFRKLQVPVFSVLEGGYSLDLPSLILAYLKGLEDK
ncbi:MAG: histone deacetylase [Verrucomicrobiae bacterium]|nr:histone deacetylase [Verrucomicrobiae bacterium]